MSTLLTFLGTGPYEPVSYVWQESDGEQAYRTHLFPLAAYHVFGPGRILLAATREVREGKGKTHYETLQRELGKEGAPVEVLAIPDGKSEAELWEIFAKLVENVANEEGLILDITYAFRTLPLLVFAVAVYLRSAKHVQIERIIYGAYEAREGDRAPIFDMTPLLELVDWLGGVEFFLRRSDAVLLGERLQRVHQQAWQERRSDELPRKLQILGTGLKSFSEALHLARPLEVMEEAKGLLGRLDEVEPEVRGWAQPFGVVLEQVRQEAEKFAYPEPHRLDAENLRRQLALIAHCVEKGLTMQAVTLAREWVVSWVILQRGEGDWLDENYREQVEWALGAAAQRSQKKEAQVPDWFDQLPNSQELGRLWNWLVDLRNGVAHCGMRKDRPGLGRIQNRAKELPERLQVLMENVSERAMYGARVVIDLGAFYEGTAKLEELPLYIERAKTLAGRGNEIVLTGQAPIWLYLAVAHALHGLARRLWYDSPVTGEVLIFAHDP
jgi:hypothetical protein